MRYHFRFIMSTLTLLLLSTWLSSTLADPLSHDTRTWNLKNVDIHTVIDALTKETGKTFIVSPQLTGKVTFMSSDPLTTDELYQAFLALLSVSGFDAIPDGPVVKIVPETYLKEEGVNFFNAKTTPAGEEMAVTIARVKYGSAAELVKVLKQLSYHFGYIESYSPTNDIIISDHANNIRRLVTLIHRLDKPSASSIDVIHLRYALPSELVKMVSSLLQQKSEGASNIVLAADDRSNDILLRGGTPEQHLQVRGLITQLDVPLNTKSIHTTVIYLKYLRAEKMAVILNALLKNYKTEKTGDGSAMASEGETPSEAAPSEKPTLVNYASQLGQTAGAQNGGSSGSGNNTTAPVDFSNMTQKQPKSGSVSPAVQWEESTNALILSAPNDLLQKLKKVIAQLDIRRPQVLIEAVIAEVEADRANELGIELNTGGRVQLLTRFSSTLPLSGVGTDNNIAISNPATPDATGQGLSGAFFRGNNLRLLLRALEQDSRSNILSTPNIVTLDNEPAQIKVGQKISFAIGQIQNNPTGGNPFNYFNQQDVGLILTINPQITSDGSIKLIIEQELSNVLPGQSSAGGNPNLSERFIHTTVMATDGDVLVLGGLIQNEWQEITNKVPILGDLPIVGLLFRSHEKQLTKQNLMVFLRPTILYDEVTKHVVGEKYQDLRHHEFDTRRAPFVSNNMDTPILPTWNRARSLPQPF